eukprot:jgi/Psemu1/32182/gm1.32182_g
MKIWQDDLGAAAVSAQDLKKRIKQIELFTKWGKLVPAEFADIISPYPGDEVMRKFKEERNNKARERTQRKQDSRVTKKKTQ